MTTEWLARKAGPVKATASNPRPGDRILCGARDADGNYWCQGLIATMLDWGPPGVFLPYVEPGVIEVRPGWWGPSGHGRKKMARGQRASLSTWPKDSAGKRVAVMKSPTLPFRRECPHHKEHVALVTADVLSSSH